MHNLPAKSRAALGFDFGAWTNVDKVCNLVFVQIEYKHIIRVITNIVYALLLLLIYKGGFIGIKFVAWSLNLRRKKKQ